jgi:hypothetical protein
MAKPAANGRADSEAGVAGVVVRIGRLYLRLLVGTAVFCFLLLGAALLLVWVGALVHSRTLLSLSPLLVMAAVVAAIGVLAPVVAVLSLLPQAVTQVGRDALRAMGVAAILGLAGAVFCLIRPLADHPESVLLLGALSLVALLGAWVAGNRIAEPVARWARRWAIGVLTVLTLWLAFTAVVPAPLRLELLEYLKHRVSEKLEPPPQRVPYASLEEYEGIRKFAQVGGRVTAVVSYCRREDREGFERYLLADRPGQDLYSDCRFEPLTPAIHREIAQYLADWEQRLAEARQAPPPTAAPLEATGTESRLPWPEGAGPDASCPPGSAVVLADHSILPDGSGFVRPVVPRRTLLAAQLEGDVDLRAANEGDVVRVRIEEMVPACGVALILEGTPGRATITRVAGGYDVRVVYLTLTALQTDAWRETHTTVARAMVTLGPDGGSGDGNAGAGVARGSRLEFMLVDDLPLAPGF